MDATQRNNIRVLLPKMRGKPKAERMQAYEAIRVGPLLMPLYMVATIVQPAKGSPT
jgi:hypothetical protein